MNNQGKGGKIAFPKDFLYYQTVYTEGFSLNCYMYPIKIKYTNTQVFFMFQSQ